MEGKADRDRIPPPPSSTRSMDAMSLSRLCQMEQDIRADLGDLDDLLDTKSDPTTTSTVMEDNDDLCESILSLCDSAETTLTGITRYTTNEDLDGLGTSPDVSLYTPSKFVVLDVANCDSVSHSTSGMSTDPCEMDTENCWNINDKAGNSSTIESKSNNRSWAKTLRPISQPAVVDISNTVAYFPISPIPQLCSSVSKVSTLGTQSSVETPIVVSKFTFLDNYNVNNSTPLLHTEKGKHPLNCKSKKAIWSTTENGHETSASEFSGFSCKSVDSSLPTPETIAAEISKVCEEGIAKGKNVHDVSETIKTDHNISKINLDSIIKNDAGKTVYPNDTIVIDSRSCIKADMTGERDSVSNSEGRFRNVDASVSYIVVDEDVEVTEDILGIDDYDELDDLDEQEEATLLNDDENQVNETNIDKTVIAAVEVKGQQNIDIEMEQKKTCETTTEKIIVDGEKPKSEFVDLKSDENSNVIEVFSHCMSGLEKKEIKLDLKDNETDCKIVDKKKLEMKAQNLKPEAATMTESKISKTIQNENKVEKTVTSDDFSIVANEFNTDNQRLADENNLMTEVRRRWKSSGIPCPDTNLTVATTFRRKTKHKGCQIVAGVLEGEHISCLNLYEDELAQERPKSGKQAIRRDKNTLGPSVKDVLNKLYRQKETLNCVKTNTLYDLRNDLAEKQRIMKQRHSMEINHLHYNQEMEVRQLNSCYTFPPYVLQRNIIQLGIEHSQQREKLKTHHMREYGMLCEQLNALLNMKTEKYSEQIVLIQACITSLESSNISTTQSKHGPLLMVEVRKAPHRNNRKHGKISMCLPANIAQAVLMEEEIYNHFYSFHNG